MSDRKQARIVALANQKGGVGKTTTAINLAASLDMVGRRVLLVDLDPQGHATMGCGLDKRQLTHSIYDVLLGEASAADVLQPVEQGSFMVLPGNEDLTAAEIHLLQQPEREQRLRHALEPLRSEYDYILIDCPPALNILAINALTAAQSVLIPIQCEYYALEGLSSLLRTIEQVRVSVNPDLEIMGIVRTMFDPRNNLANEVSAQLIAHFPDRIYRTVIPRNVRLAEAPSFGQAAIYHDKSSRGALAYLALANEIKRREPRAPGDQDRLPQAAVSAEAGLSGRAGFPHDADAPEYAAPEAEWPEDPTATGHEAETDDGSSATQRAAASDAGTPPGTAAARPSGAPEDSPSPPAKSWRTDLPEPTAKQERPVDTRPALWPILDNPRK